MKERPILFNSEMVLSILDGHKTQTRRPVKFTESGNVKEPRRQRRWHRDDPNAILACPLGVVGDKLWVRETFADINDREFLLYKATDEPTFNKACETLGEKLIWTPSIHMPRWASRITLEVADVRIERIQDITESDAKAEGIPEIDSIMYADEPIERYSAVARYRRLWDQIYGKAYDGKYVWNNNLYVWAVTFKVIEDK